MEITLSEHLKHVPIVNVQLDFRQQSRLDLLSADYLNLFDNVVDYEVFLIDVGHEYQPFKIAHKFYRNKNLWRYPLLYNGIINPLDPKTGLYAGREILIPSLSDIEQYILSIRRDNSASQNAQIRVI
jgi:hypothetical protein